METWYLADFYIGITRVEAVRSTAHFIILPWRSGRTRRVRKLDRSHAYFKTWKEAHAHLIEQAENRLLYAKEGILSAQQRLERNVKNLSDLQAMKEPPHAP